MWALDTKLLMPLVENDDYKEGLFFGKKFWLFWVKLHQWSTVIGVYNHIITLKME